MVQISERLINKKVFAGGDERRIIRLQSNKFNIQLENIEDYLYQIEKEARKRKKNIEVMLRGQNIHQWTTIKGYEEDYNSERLEEYYDNRAREPEKFKSFNIVDVYIRIYK